MARGQFVAAIYVGLMVLSVVHCACIDENDALISLLFKKLDKLQDGHQDEMKEKMENMQEEMAGMREKMQDEMAGMREKMENMQVKLAGMSAKQQGYEEINKLKLERMEERVVRLDNKASEAVDNGSNNESSLALAVYQLHTTLENLQTTSTRGDSDTNRQDHVTKQMSRLIAPIGPASETNMSHITTAVEILTNGLNEVRTNVEDLQAKVEDLVVSEGGGNQQLAYKDNTTGTYTNKIRPRYCHDIYIQGERRDGVYEIYPGWNITQSISVWCEFDVGSEVGWTIILARMPTEDPVNFDRGWDDYKAGFGDAHNEYWIGLSLLHEIFISHCSQILRVNLESWDHTSRYAQYKDFSIGDEESGFKLLIGGYSGDAADALAHHKNMKFTTKDKDNDKSGSNCAALGNKRGGFWYNNCYHTNPLGELNQKGGKEGMRWNKWLSSVNLKKIIFKISPRLPILI